MQDLFLHIPEGSIVSYPVFTQLSLPLDTRRGDQDKNIKIYNNDVLVGIYKNNICHSDIKKDEMKALLSKIFEYSDAIKIIC